MGNRVLSDLYKFSSAHLRLYLSLPVSYPSFRSFLVMSAFTSSWLSTLAVLSIALCAFAAPNISARQQPGGSQYTGWLSLPAVSGATVHKDWPMKGATFVSVSLEVHELFWPNLTMYSLSICRLPLRKETHLL